MELFLFMIHSTNTQRASAMCLALVWVPGRQRRAERRLFPYSSLSRESSREWEKQAVHRSGQEGQSPEPRPSFQNHAAHPVPQPGQRAGNLFLRPSERPFPNLNLEA